MCDNLWNGKEVIGIISGHGFTEWVATGVSIDTRTLNKGDIFFDSGMYQGNNRNYSQWRSANWFWEELVYERYTKAT